MDRALLLPNRLRECAHRTPDRVLVHDVDGPSYTYREIVSLADRWAAAFRAAGVRADENVLTLVHPSGIWLAAWVGLASIHAVDTGVHTEYRGRWLHDAIARSRARVIVVSAELAVHLTADVLDGTAIERVVVEGGDGRLPDLPRQAVWWEDFLAVPERGCSPRPPGDDPVQPWNTAYMVLTGGTTGPSKYVIVPWAHAYQGARGIFGPDELDAADVLYSPLPVFHVATRFMVYDMVLRGGSIVLRRRVSVSAFWDDVRAYGCTVALMLGYARMVLDQPPSPHDRDHRLTWSIQGPTIPEYERFTERFGTRVRTAFGSSEIGVPIAVRGDTVPNAETSGRVVDEGHTGFEVRLVDEHDQPVPPGDVGELIIRTAEPWALMPSYFEMPAESALAWRNGWFHTGDGFRVDDTGNYYFVDRIKDTIRRRGESISSFEIEKVVAAHPGVAECAAVAYRDAAGEDEVRLFVVRSVPGITTEGLVVHLERALPRHMLPSILEFVDELPKSAAAARVKKKDLRARPVPAHAWVGSAARRRADRSRPWKES